MNDNEAHARNNDPETSHDAAKKVKVGHLEALVLGVLRRHPHGMCGKEISHILRLQIDSIRPRFAPLERKGFIERAEGRVEYEGSRHIVWRVKGE